MSTGDTIPTRLFLNAEQHAEQAAYYTRVQDAWHTTTWKEYAEHVCNAGKAMLALGVERGRCLAILGNNRPEWAIFSLAAMSIGSASAGLYTNTLSDALQEIIHHAECPIILVENAEQWEKVQAHRERLPLLRQIIVMSDAEEIDDPLTLSWDAFLACGESVARSDFQRRLDKVTAEQIATFTYKMDPETGPKGTMLSHRNLAWTAQTLTQMLSATSKDSGFSSLPMAHMSEQLFTLHLPITAGFPVYYSRSIPTLLEDLQHAQPTIFFSIPLIWSEIVKKAQRHIHQFPEAQKKKAEQAMQLGAQVTSTLLKGKSTGFLTHLKMSLVHSKTLHQLKQHIGLGEARFCVSALTSLTQETLDFLAGLELPVFEAYGHDETSGLAILNLPGAAQFGSIGQPLPEVEYQFDATDRLQLRGPNIFLGYFKDTRASAEVLQFGWYTTETQGHTDENGFLYVDKDA